MQDHSDNWDETLQGTLTTSFVVDAWYDGDLVAEALPLSSGSVTLDSTRAIAGSASVTIAGDESLVPSSFDSSLACYGSQLHIRAGLVLPDGVELMSLGWFRIDSYSASERWKPYQLPEGPKWVPMGVLVSNECSDLMSLVDDARMLAPQQPAQLSSAITEIQNLVSGIVPVEDMSGITDAAIPKSITYSDSLTAALTDLAALVGCVPRMSPDGALELVPSAPGLSVWRVEVGEDGVPLLGWTRSGDRSGLYNGVVSTGQAADGTPLQGSWQETTGPLRWGGPFGQVPFGHANPLLTTQLAAQKDAQTTGANLSQQRTVVIPVSCPPNFALQPLDVVDVALPDRTLTGPVQSITWQLTPAAMTMNVAVPRDSLWGTT